MPGSGELDRDRLFSRPASSDRSRFFLPAGVTSNPTVAAGWVLIIGAALLMLGVVVGRGELMELVLFETKKVICPRKYMLYIYCTVVLPLTGIISSSET